MYKTKNRGFTIKDIAALILGAVLHGVCTAILCMIFYGIQMKLFMDKGDVIFLHSSMTNYILPVGLAFVFIFLWMRIVAQNSGFLLPWGKVKYVSLSLICLIITLTVAFVDMFNYARIRDEGLYIRANVVGKTEYTPWNMVDSVRVSYGYSARKLTKYDYYYKYQLVSRGGEIIDMEWAEDYKKWDKVVFMHNYFKSKGLKMDIEAVDKNILDEIKPRYIGDYGEHTEEVLKTIFEYRD